MPTWMTSTSADVFRGKRCWFAVPAGHVFNCTRAGDELGGDNKQSEERETMRKATRTLAVALLLAGSAALTAAAQTSRGASDINSAAQNFTPIEQVACRGWGPYCRPGFHPGLRSVPMLVPPLLVTHAPATGRRSAALVASASSKMLRPPLARRVTSRGASLIADQIHCGRQPNEAGRLTA